MYLQRYSSISNGLHLVILGWWSLLKIRPVKFRKRLIIWNFCRRERSRMKIKLPIVHNDWRKEKNKGNDDNSLPWKTEEEATTNQHHHHPTIVMKWNGSYLVQRQSITNKFNLIQVIRHIRHLCLSVQRMAMHKALVTWKNEPFSLFGRMVFWASMLRYRTTKLLYAIGAFQ